MDLSSILPMILGNNSQTANPMGGMDLSMLTKLMGQTSQNNLENTNPQKTNDNNETTQSPNANLQDGQTQKPLNSFYPSPNNFPFEKSTYQDYNNFKKTSFKLTNNLPNNNPNQNFSNYNNLNSFANNQNSQHSSQHNSQNDGTNSASQINTQSPLASLLPLLTKGQNGDMSNLLSSIGSGGKTASLNGLDINSLMGLFSKSKTSNVANKEPTLQAKTTISPTNSKVSDYKKI